VKGVGIDVGCEVGDVVGTTVGDGLGLRVGEAVGAGVGVKVGMGEGAADGICVGNWVGKSEPVGSNRTVDTAPSIKDGGISHSGCMSNCNAKFAGIVELFNMLNAFFVDSIEGTTTLTSTAR